jgi:hypothetical protein
MDFDGVFGRNQFNPNIALLDALGLGGGGTDALARHATAALLNSDSDMTFAYSPAGVIDLYQDAIDGFVDVETAKNMLAATNEEGCPFDHDDDWRLNWHEPDGCEYVPDCDQDSVSDGGNDPDGSGPEVPGPDNCVVLPNSSQADWDSDSLGDACDDGDGDGFVDSSEGHVGTGRTSPCGVAGWPADLYGEGMSYNKLDVQDILSFVAPVRRIDKSPADNGYSVRWDILPGTTVLYKQVNIQDLLELVTVRPQMFGGAPAYGKSCPNP